MYLATWVGPAAFYLGFQRRILAAGEHPGARAILWGPDREEPAVRPAGWRVEVAENGLEVPVPPGVVESIEADGEGLQVTHAGGAYRVQGFPPGFLRSLLDEECERVGGAPGAGWVPEASLFREVVRESPARYRLGWSGRERSLYAARLLTKLLLLDPEAVRSIELEWRDEPPGAALSSSAPDGGAKIVAVDARGLLVVLLPPEAPAAWRDHPGAWLRPAEATGEGPSGR